MANISDLLARIMSAVYGRDVRGSIHDAIDIINEVSEKILDAGTEISNGDLASKTYGTPPKVGYDHSYYFNTSTNDLLMCDGTIWSIVDNIEGNGISSITGPVSSGLIDTYTINFTKILTPFTFQVANGKGISSITGPISVGLVDTYTINYNDGTTQSYIVTNGRDGKTWYRGTLVYGKVNHATVFSGSGIANAQEGDFYLNSNEGAIYHCVTGGDPTVATWIYDFTMAGGGGSSIQKLDDLDDVSIDTTSLSNNQILIYDSVTGDFVNSSLSPSVQSGDNKPVSSGTVYSKLASDYYTKTEIDSQEKPLAKNGGSKQWDDLINNAATYLVEANTNKFYTLTTAGTVTSSNESLFVSGIVEGEHFSKDSHIAVVEDESNPGTYLYDYFGGGVEPEVYFDLTDTATVYTFTHDAINSDSAIMPFSSIKGDKWTDITIVGNTCTVTMASSKSRTVRIYVK